MNKNMSAIELKEHIIEFLREHKEGVLATVYNNVPRCSPVQYFLGSGLDIYVISAGGDKFKAIAQNPNVCLLVNTNYINYRQIKGVQIFGKVTTSLQDSSLFDEAIMYSPDPYLLEHEKNSIKIMKIIPEEIVYLDSLKQGDRTKQILKNGQVIIKEDVTVIQ